MPMTHKKLEAFFLEQSNNLIWMVDSDVLLTYANPCYLNLVKQVSGKEKKLHEPVLVESFGEGAEKNGPTIAIHQGQGSNFYFTIPKT